MDTREEMKAKLLARRERDGVTHGTGFETTPQQSPKVYSDDLVISWDLRDWFMSLDT